MMPYPESSVLQLRQNGCDGLSDEMEWEKPEHGRGEVDRAGKIIINPYLPSPFPAQEELDMWEEDSDTAVRVVSNWRAAHSYPLQALKMTLRQRARRIDSRALVNQRLKRLPAIVIKLQRNSNMQLSQMQDIGGCRAVVSTVRHVDALVKLHQDAALRYTNQRRKRARPALAKMYDYITCPKEDGYRSFHLIYKYGSPRREHRAWNGLRIELQLRSRLQHAWATAVETVDAFTSQTLKTGGGKEKWKRFFLLMGSAVALMEERPQCPETPKHAGELATELQQLCDELNVRTVLRQWSTALTYLPEHTSKGAALYLLHLDTAKQSIEVKGFSVRERKKAHREYVALEKSIGGKPSSFAVLVTADSVQALKSGYRSWFADTKVFLEAVNSATSL